MNERSRSSQFQTWYLSPTPMTHAYLWTHTYAQTGPQECEERMGCVQHFSSYFLKWEGAASVGVGLGEGVTLKPCVVTLASNQ